jgi:hypothetical protein
MKRIRRILIYIVVMILFCFTYSNAAVKCYKVKNNIFVETYKKSKISLDSITTNNGVFIILFNGYSCFDCFKTIIKAIDSISNSKTGNYCFLIRCNDVFDRKKKFEQLKKIKNICDSLFFDIHASQDVWPPHDYKDGIFSLFPIVQTPAIIYFNKITKTMNFTDYIELFSENQKIDLKKVLLELKK